jgi:hypothetical protein
VKNEEWILKNILTDPTSTLTDVDTWEGSEELIHKEFDWSNVESFYDKRMSKFSNIKKHKGTSISYLQSCTEKFDFIYIDGDHEYEGCKKDLLEAYKKVKNGGWLMGHDYEMNMNKANTVYNFGVRKAVDEFCKEFSQIIYAMGNDGCVSYAIKIIKAGHRV